MHQQKGVAFKGNECLQGHAAPVTHIAINERSNQIISLSADKVIKVSACAYLPLRSMNMYVVAVSSSDQPMHTKWQQDADPDRVCCVFCKLPNTSRKLPP